MSRTDAHANDSQDDNPPSGARSAGGPYPAHGQPMEPWADSTVSGLLSAARGALYFVRNEVVWASGEQAAYARSIEGRLTRAMAECESSNLLEKNEAFQKVAAQLEAAKRQMFAEMAHHALTCPDLVGCELRAWQALFRSESAKTPAKGLHLHRRETPSIGSDVPGGGAW